MNAIDKLKKAADNGQIRRFTGNDYASDFTSGNLVAGDRLVRGRGAAPGRQPGHRVADADPGLLAVVGQHGDPGRRPEHRRRRSGS